MSPAGISMLYAATDEQTALAETIEPSSSPVHYTVATLRLRAAVRVADFVHLPPATDLFTAGTTREGRAGTNFVRAFAVDLSKPIVRNGMAHVEYVPTQVVTEYLRYRFRARRRKVFGIQYSSARNTGGTNVALFIGHEDLNSTSPWRIVSPAEVDLVGVRHGVR
jgi:RES domain